MAGKKGMKIPSRSVSKARKERLIDNWRESVQAGSIIKRLRDHGDGKLENELSPTQIKAYEVILARLVPTLTAVEQTNVNTEDSLTEEQILLKLQQVIDAHPEVVAKMLQAKQSKPDPTQDCGVNTESAAQQGNNAPIMSSEPNLTH